MRKKVFGRQLSRGRKAREALIVALIRALIVCGQITTTRAKAKAVCGQVDKLVTLAKGGDLSVRRQVLAYLRNDRDVCDKVFQNVLPAFATRVSGFTRMILLPPRRGDSAEMARLEWVEKIVTESSLPAGKTGKQEVGKKDKKELVSAENKKKVSKK